MLQQQDYQSPVQLAGPFKASPAVVCSSCTRESECLLPSGNLQGERSLQWEFQLGKLEKPHQPRVKREHGQLGCDVNRRRYNGAFHLPRKTEFDATPELTAFQLTSRKTKTDALFYQLINHLAHNNNLACKAACDCIVINGYTIFFNYYFIE